MLKKQRTRGSVSVSSQTKINGSNESKETTDSAYVELNTPSPAYVKVSGGLTKNMGDYNSVRIDVAVTMPCLPTDQDVRSTYESVSKLVDELLSKELNNVCV